MCLDFGPVIRIYVAKDGAKLIVLLGGGTKHRLHLDIEAAKQRWQDYRGRSPKSLMRMLSRQGNPHIRNLFEIIAHLQQVEGRTLRLSPAGENDTKAA